MNEKYRPLSPWAYFIYQILFALPFFGIIFLVFCAISDKNINRRNFARSYFCIYVLIFILFIICLIFFNGFIDKIVALFTWK